ncbi:YitT family protein [Gemelliphila palaticanis]|nr:YitT family protein [Gemella palaticanis]
MLKESLYAVDKKKRTKELICLIIGTMIFSFYAGVFLPQNNLAAGGALGLALAANKIFGLKIGLGQILLNAPLFYISLRYIGKKFTIVTSIVILVSSIFIDILPQFFTNANLQDKLVAAVFAGLMSGVGLGFILIAGGSTGGSDITAKYFTNKYKLNIASVILAQDIFIYCIIWMAFDIRYVMYALIMSFTRNNTIKGIQKLLSAYIQCTIITEKPDKLVDVINNEMHRGSSIIEVEGGYTHKKRQMIILVIQQNELYHLKKIIKEHCPDAFITINSINAIMGNFKEHSYRL